MRIPARKNPVSRRGFGCTVGGGLDGFDVGGLQTLGAFFDREFNALAFFEVAETLALDSGEVDEDIRAAFAGDESVAFATIEPLDRTDDTFRHFLPPSKAKQQKGWKIVVQ
jgi:hypothetical protein